MLLNFENKEVWFIVGSQNLYGRETLDKVDQNAKKIATALHDSNFISIVYKSVATSTEEITAIIKKANYDDNCIGLIVWMHTFSPGKMWINGLKLLQKPLLHLHTQFNQKIPWADIDMDFMNLNQSAHGGREFGHACARVGVKRKVVVGHWKDTAVSKSIDEWSRVALAYDDSQEMRIARFGDNMREVSVTEGDKVSAQLQFGYRVDGYGLGDLATYIESVTSVEITHLISEYDGVYRIDKSLKSENNFSLIEAARIELGISAFLKDGGFSAFTTTFENLTGLKQLPGIAVQQLMALGYGFGAEGDWKTAALVRSMKVMSMGLSGGSSFMEDYTYHFDDMGSKVLGAHMLEICPTISNGFRTIECHPLGIGGKEDPVRIVFDIAPGDALNASIVSSGDSFKLIVNPVTVELPEKPMPNLPVARGLWIPHPDLNTAARLWIEEGGSHHTCFSQNVTISMLQDFAMMMEIDCRVIGG